MKNYIKTLCTILALASVGTVSAKQMSASDIEKLSEFDVNGNKFNETVYIFGKHVHFNTFTMADLESAANTLDGATNAFVYYKDGGNEWKKATKKNELVDVSNVKFEMIKLITEEKKYAGALEIEELPDGRYVQTYNDETSPSKIIGIRSVKAIDLETNEKKVKHHHNTASLNVKFDAISKEINFIENVPLLKYKNGSTVTGKWFGLLVKTNKKVTNENKDNIQIGIKNYGDKDYYKYSIDDVDIIDAKRHGGEINEFVVWLDGSRLSNNSIIEFSEKNPSTGKLSIQYLNVNYNKPKITYEENSNKLYKYTDLREDVKIKSIKIDEDNYINIFFTDNTKLKSFTFREDGVLKTAIKNENTFVIHKLMDKLIITKGATIDLGDKTMTDAHKWNQESFDIKVEKSTTNKNEYIVNMIKNRVFIEYKNASTHTLPWYSLLIDFGIDPHEYKMAVIKDGVAPEYSSLDEIDIKGAKDNGATTDTAFVMWANSNKNFKLSFKNNNVPEDEYIVNLLFTDNVKKLNLNSVKLGNVVDLTPNVEDEALKDSNTKFKHNMNNLAIKTSYNKETDEYRVKINAKDELLSYKGRNGKYHKGYSLILDFGINPKLLVSDQYNIEQKDIDDAKRHGATTDTAFVMWLSGEDDTTTIEFKNKETNDTIKFIVDVTEVEKVMLDNKNAKEIVISKEFVDKVTYDKTKNAFIVSEGVTTFEVSVDNIKFIYKKDGTWNQVQQLNLINVFKGNVLTEYKNDQVYNQNSIEEVTFDAKAKTVNVVFNRQPASYQLGKAPSVAKWYSIVVNLGIKSDKVSTKVNSGYHIENENRTDANRHVDDTNKSENNIVLWLKADETDLENGKTLTFVNIDDETIEYPIVVKSSYKENKNDLKVISISNIDASKMNANEPFAKEIQANTRGVNPVVENGNIIINNTIPFVKYVNDSGLQEKKGWFGLIIDLGIDPLKISAVKDGENGYIINECDKTDAKHFGSTSKTAFILWLREESFKGKDNTRTITFLNNMEDNKENKLTVKFTLNNLFIKTVKKATPIDLGEEYLNHKNNQEAYEVSLNGNDILLNLLPNKKLISYTKPAGKKEWVALILDFGINLDRIKNNSNNQEVILSTDKDEVKLHGATTETELLLWIPIDFNKELKLHDNLTNLDITVNFKKMVSSD